MGACALFLFALPASAATSTEAYVPTENEFAAAIVTRADGKVLYEFKADKSHTVASITKLLQALTMLDKKWNWNTTVTMSKADEVGGGRLRVAVGSKIRLSDLWQSSIGSSANNAATAMARIGGPGVSTFVKKMNTKAKSLGAGSSVFYDPSGMDARNKTTARDLVKIVRAAFREELIVQASQRGPYTFALVNTGTAHSIKNTNAPLLEDPNIWLVGGKTGYLPESMYNYGTTIRPMNAEGKSDPKKELSIVILGAQSQASTFDSVRRLANWAWAQPELFKGSMYQPPTRPLSYGLNGDDVRWLQENLKIDTVNGNFGPKTLAAVKAFQQTHKIAKPGDRAFGIVGPATRAKLIELAP